LKFDIKRIKSIQQQKAAIENLDKGNNND